MAVQPPFAGNIRRIRESKGLTQQEVANRSGLSRIGFRGIETGKSRNPGVGHLQSIAAALAVGLDELLAEPPRLTAARFRSHKLRRRKDRASREEINIYVARWLSNFIDLEGILDDRLPYRLAEVAAKVRSIGSKDRPRRVAAMARKALSFSADDPIADICGLLESGGVKVCVLERDLNWFFGLSAVRDENDRAVVVNVWRHITGERQIFTAAHELGHLLLHPGAYDINKIQENKAEEREADKFASHFLMPQKGFEKQWQAASGYPLVDRVLRTKRLFRVSYKTVLTRMIELGLVSDQAWKRFNTQYGRRYGRRLGHKEEPYPLTPVDFVENRLRRMVRQAVERQEISLGRAAEILGVNLQTMRDMAASWDIAA